MCADLELPRGRVISTKVRVQVSERGGGHAGKHEQEAGPMMPGGKLRGNIACGPCGTHYSSEMLRGIC